MRYPKFPTEGNFEAALCGLGMPVSERFLREHYAAMAGIDDLLSDVKVKDIIEEDQRDEPSDEDDVLQRLQSMVAMARMSQAQWMVFFQSIDDDPDAAPIMYRLGLGHDILMTYEVSVEGAQNPIAAVIDGYVTSDTDRSEQLKADYTPREGDELGLLNAYIEVRDGSAIIRPLGLDTTMFEWDNVQTFCVARELDVESRMYALRRAEQEFLEGKMHPYDAYKLVVDLLRPEVESE